MAQDIVRIAVIGGGRTGTPLIEHFLATPYVRLVGVADADPGCPGALLAKDNGVLFTTDPLLLASKGDDMDIVIEVSGDERVKGLLKEAFVAHGNRHTIIMQDLVARLLVSMVSDSTDLMPTYHPKDVGIG